MNNTIVLLAVGGVLLVILAGFLGKELLKKFKFFQRFVENSNQLVTYHYTGNRQPGMYNIVLRGEKPFSVLVGFDLHIPIIAYTGIDYYGFVRSDENGIAVISTYMGKGGATFQFFVNTDLEHNHICASSSNDDQILPPHVTYPPHWWQRLGFYG